MRIRPELNPAPNLTIIGPMTSAHARDSLSTFVHRSEGRRHALVLPRHADTIAAALLERKGCVPADKEGRGSVLRFPCGDGWGILRPYLRGGVMQHVLKDAFILANRPRRELAVHAYLYAQGIAVPEPLGACWERSGLLIRGAIATREIKAENLLELAARAHGDINETLRSAGELIRQMHDKGVFHADLQVRNILATQDGVFLIDFDNARITNAISPVHRARNLLRLKRSIEKNGLDPGIFDAIREGYGAEALPAWLGRVYDARGKASDLMSGRK